MTINEVIMSSTWAFGALVVAGWCVSEINKIKQRQFYDAGYSDYPIRHSGICGGCFIDVGALTKSYNTGWKAAEREHNENTIIEN